MRAYLSFFKIRYSASLQYRAAAIAGMLTQFAWGFMRILLFTSVIKQNPSASAMSVPELTSYIWLQQAFLALFMLWLWDADIFNAITEGNIAYELARPVSLYSMWFIRNAARRLSMATLRCVPILAVATFLPRSMGLSAPMSVTSLALFILSMTLSIVVVVSLTMIIVVLTFYTLNPRGIMIVAAGISEFLSGSIIPLPLLPEKLRFVIELLPFASGENTPMLIYSGHITGLEIVRYMGVQVFWAAALITLGYTIMSRALKRVVVQGG